MRIVKKRQLSDFKLNKEQEETLLQLAKELNTIEKKIPFVKEVIVRGGFLLDTILGAKPNDIDLFYSLRTWQNKDWPGCKCDEIRKRILSLNLPLTSTHKVDLGHILKGEIYIDPIPKITGYFSHHIDIPSMICLDSKDNLWATNETVYCIKNRIHEIRYLGVIQHSYYPYSENKYYLNYITSSARLIIRGLRMIHTKKYSSVGANFKELLENSLPIFDWVSKREEYLEAVRQNMADKNGFMKFDDYRKALEVSGVNNQQEILRYIKKLIELDITGTK